MAFHDFKHIIAANFAALSQYPLFRTGATKDELWGTYLASFPPGTDPIFRKRTGHDCSCCRQFIKAVGNVVAITPDNVILTIWDVANANLDPAYVTVADAMADLVRSRPIENVFVHDVRTAGTDKNFEQIIGEPVRTWEHFFVNIPTQFVKPKAGIPTFLGEVRATFDVFKRGLMELDRDALDTVLELIAQNSLYRGEEHKHNLVKFRDLLHAYHRLPEDERGPFVWVKSTTLPQSLTRLRNTSIGALLIDLSEGVELEQAVKKFETMAAPANYKRPTALVTPAMIAKAKVTVEGLGLTSALERRYATLADITAPNTLFVDRSVRSKIAPSNVFDDLAAQASTKAKPNLDKVESIHSDNFLTNILPQAKSVEAFFENRHQSNLVSLVAPADPTAGRLFKWDNLFSWSYNGDFADSDIRAAVQARGGRVDGVFRFSHSWNYDKRNASLMDLHVFMPGNKANPDNQINDSYGNAERVGWNHRKHAASGGEQDVDYTSEAPVGYVPVENITFPSLGRMPEGTYVCKIHNWQLRTPTQGGFRAEIEFSGEVFQYEVDRPLKHKEWVTVAEVTLKNGAFTIKHHLPTSTTSKTVWNLPTQQFHPVTILMNSPNYWDGQGVGNRHFFFMLDSCRSDGTARGFYNEFLKSELDQHRKVFEMVGAKMRTDDTDRQLSGLGFSSTQRNHVLVKVTGAFTRTLKVEF